MHALHVGRRRGEWQPLTRTCSHSSRFGQRVVLAFNVRKYRLLILDIG